MGTSVFWFKESPLSPISFLQRFSTLHVKLCTSLHFTNIWGFSLLRRENNVLLGHCVTLKQGYEKRSGTFRFKMKQRHPEEFGNECLPSKWMHCRFFVFTNAHLGSSCLAVIFTLWWKKILTSLSLYLHVCVSLCSLFFSFLSSSSLWSRRVRFSNPCRVCNVKHMEFEIFT